MLRHRLLTRWNLVGAVAEGRGRKVIGIDASGKPEATKAEVMKIARATAQMLDESLVVNDEDVVLDERFHAGIYGIPDETTVEAMKCEFCSSSIWSRLNHTQWQLGLIQ